MSSEITEQPGSSGRAADTAAAGIPAAQALARQILADRFEVVTDPLAWRCRGCKVTVAAALDEQGQPQQRELDRLAEAAADHALHCGRCDD